jgi:hypothetical protein
VNLVRGKVALPSKPKPPSARIAFLAAASLAACNSSDHSGGPGAGADSRFERITNGRDLTGWKGDSRYWRFEDGAITGETTEANKGTGPTYLVWKGGEAADFELRGQYRFAGDYGNSGVQYRSQEGADFLVTGYQADFEVGDQWNGVLVEMGGRLHLARRGQKVEVGEDGRFNVVGSVGNANELQAAVKKNDWNSFEIVARGPRLIHKINGRVMTDTVDGESSKAARSGIIALQLNRSRPMKVQFKDIEIKRLAN